MVEVALYIHRELYEKLMVARFGLEKSRARCRRLWKRRSKRKGRKRRKKRRKRKLKKEKDMGRRWNWNSAMVFGVVLTSRFCG